MEEEKNKSLYTLLLVLALSLFVLFTFLFTKDFRRLRYSGAFGRSTSSLRELYMIRRHYSPTAQDSTYIQGWMTFSYINRVFNVPNDYLRQQLHIADTHYPSVSVSEVAESQHASLPQFLITVRGAVARYLSPITSP